MNSNLSLIIPNREDLASALLSRPAARVAFRTIGGHEFMYSIRCLSPGRHTPVIDITTTDEAIINRIAQQLAALTPRDSELFLAGHPSIILIAASVARLMNFPLIILPPHESDADPGDRTTHTYVEGDAPPLRITTRHEDAAKINGKYCTLITPVIRTGRTAAAVAAAVSNLGGYATPALAVCRIKDPAFDPDLCKALTTMYVQPTPP